MASIPTMAPSNWLRELPVLALAGLLLISRPVHGEEPSAPSPDGRYRVTGVVAGDQLNVRKQAGVSTTIAGRIAPGVGGIMVSGIWEKIDDTNWWHVIPSPTNAVTRLGQQQLSRDRVRAGCRQRRTRLSAEVRGNRTVLVA